MVVFSGNLFDKNSNKDIFNVDFSSLSNGLSWKWSPTNIHLFDNYIVDRIYGSNTYDASSKNK